MRCKALIFIVACGLSCVAAAAADGDESHTATPASGVPVRVRTIEVESIEAQLTAIDDASVRLIIDGEEKALPLESILHIATDAPPAQTIKSASEVVCHLVGGGVISGAVGADASPGVVRLNLQESLSLDLPLASIAAIRFPGASDQALQDEFNARRMERKPGRDVLLLLNAGRVSVVPGALEALTADRWTFRFGDRSRSGAITGAAGVILGSAAQNERALRVRVGFGDDNRLAAEAVRADSRSVTVDAGSLGRVTIPWSLVRAIAFESSRVEKLTGLTLEVDDTQTIAGGAWPAQRDRNVAGGPMRIGARQFDSGWGVHAASRVEFSLGGRYERLIADIGVDASVAPRGSVVFRVLVDGDERFASDRLRGGEASRRISVELAGADRLTLVCDPTDDLDMLDYGNWANPILVMRSESESP